MAMPPPMPMWYKRSFSIARQDAHVASRSVRTRPAQGPAALVEIELAGALRSMFHLLQPEVTDDEIDGRESGRHEQRGYDARQRRSAERGRTQRIRRVADRD